MYPKAEAEPLRTHSQAEPGNERFSTLSRLMSMAKRGYVEIPEHWRYSSARNYLGEPGLIEIDPLSRGDGTLERPRLHSHAGAWERSDSKPEAEPLRTHS